MITMALFGKIRRMRFWEGLSISEIARRTSLSRNTIRFLEAVANSPMGLGWRCDKAVIKRAGVEDQVEY